MTGFIVRRLLVSIPLLCGISLLAYLLSHASGSSFFDQYKADPRFDPAVVREMERKAHLDRPVLMQYLHWLRGVLFDIQVFHRERELCGFEQPPAAIGRWVRARKGGITWHRSSADSFAGRSALLVDGGDRGGEIEIELPVVHDDETLVWQARAESPAVIMLGGRNQPVNVTWGEIEERAPPVAPLPASLVISVPASARLYVDAIRARARSLDVSVGTPDFGRSFKYDVAVLDLIAPYLRNSFALAMLAMLFTWGVALPLGTYCAVRQNGWLDRWSSLLGFIGMSVPSYFLALLALYFTVAYLNEWLGFVLLPIGGAATSGYESMALWRRWLDQAWHLVLPVLVLSFASIAELQRVTRGSLLETLRAQYVTVARAKGLPERTVIYKYAFLNAVNPLVSIFGYRLSSLLSGAALVEIVFAYPGMGKIVLEATLSHDLYVMMAAVLIGSLLLVVGNLLADLLLRFLDPRIEHGG